MCRCESRDEQGISENGGNTPKDIREQAREGADQRGSLDIGQTVEPVEETLNGNQDIAFLPLYWGKQHQSMVLLKRLRPVIINLGLVGV